MEEKRQAAAEQARLQEERRLAAEKTQLEEQERQRKAAEQKAQQQKLEAERQAAAEQARLEEELYLDPETRLMWTIRDNGKDIDGHQANQYAGQLRLGGYSDWRLPTIDELEKLYDPHNSTIYKIRKPFWLTSYCVWSSTKVGSGSAWFFYFSNGKRNFYPMVVSDFFRALCVRRSGK